MREMAFSDTASLTPSVQKLKTKGAQKRKRSALDDNSATQEPSFWEHVDAQFPNNQASDKTFITKKKNKCV